jgi:hypothetical protein
LVAPDGMIRELFNRIRYYSQQVLWANQPRATSPCAAWDIRGMGLLLPG